MFIQICWFETRIQVTSPYINIIYNYILAKVLQVHDECLISDGAVLNGWNGNTSHGWTCIKLSKQVHTWLKESMKTNWPNEVTRDSNKCNRQQRGNTTRAIVYKRKRQTTSRVASFIKKRVALFGVWLTLHWRMKIIPSRFKKVMKWWQHKTKWKYNCEIDRNKTNQTFSYGTQEDGNTDHEIDFK